jgi:hypothetical protein
MGEHVGGFDMMRFLAHTIVVLWFILIMIGGYSAHRYECIDGYVLRADFVTGFYCVEGYKPIMIEKDKK